MENKKELNQYIIKEEEMEKVTGGSLTDLLIKRQKFQKEKEEQKKKNEQTVFSDETGAWGGW